MHLSNYSGRLHWLAGIVMLLPCCASGGVVFQVRNLNASAVACAPSPTPGSTPVCDQEEDPRSSFDDFSPIHLEVSASSGGTASATLDVVSSINVSTGVAEFDASGRADAAYTGGEGGYSSAKGGGVLFFQITGNSYAFTVTGNLSRGNSALGLTENISLVQIYNNNGTNQLIYSEVPPPDTSKPVSGGGTLPPGDYWLIEQHESRAVPGGNPSTWASADIQIKLTPIGSPSPSPTPTPTPPQRLRPRIATAIRSPMNGKKRELQSMPPEP